MSRSLRRRYIKPAHIKRHLVKRPKNQTLRPCHIPPLPWHSTFSTTRLRRNGSIPLSLRPCFGVYASPHRAPIVARIRSIYGRLLRRYAHWYDRTTRSGGAGNRVGWKWYEMTEWGVENKMRDINHGDSAMYKLRMTRKMQVDMTRRLIDSAVCGSNKSTDRGNSKNVARKACTFISAWYLSDAFLLTFVWSDYCDKEWNGYEMMEVLSK